MVRYYIIKDGIKTFFYKLEGESKRYATNPCVIGEYSVYNPTEAMLLADGWIEEQEQPYVRTLSEAKADALKNLKDYDVSNSVNAFSIDGDELWLDKDTRAGLRLRFESEQAKGLTETTLWYGTVSYTLPISLALNILLELEYYASQCYDNTSLHAKNITELSSIEEVDSYDYTTGYPEKLHFTLTVEES